MGQPISLYIHVPFCTQKCFYCAFFSQAHQERLIPAYFQALNQELQLYLPQLSETKITTIYIGGGTPSLVEPDYIAGLLATIKNNLNCGHQIEITLEANPESLTQPKLAAYADAGINRLSIGLQAWQPHLLRALNRPYQLNTFLQVYRLVQQSKIHNCNLDLMFGLPNQTLAEWQDSLEQTIALRPNHISCYSLELDNQSVFGRRVQRGTLSIPSERLDRMMYTVAKKLLSKAGYQQYELSNFALPGFESQHNSAFWRNDSYLGLGAGAASCWHAREWMNVANTADYIAKLNTHQLPIKQQVKLTAHDQLIAAISLGLRLTNGVNLDQLIATYQPATPVFDWSKLEPLITKRLIKKIGSHCSLTSRGQDIADTVIAAIITNL